MAEIPPRGKNLIAIREVPVFMETGTSFVSYGVRMADGPLAGMLARAVVVIGKDGKVAYTELVPEITQEPDYEKALAAVK